MQILEKHSWRAKHDEVIGALPRRPWFQGDSLLDDIWPISTERGGQERAKATSIRFDVPIRGWPNATRLNTADLSDDLITAKLLIFLSLEPEPVGWLKIASSVGPFHRRHLNYIRWRVDRGVWSNQLLTPAHHRDFERRYRRAGLEGLLDLREKAERLVDAIKKGDLILPKSDRDYFFNAGLEALLGLSLNQTPPEAIEVLSAYAEETGLRFNRTPRKPSVAPNYAARRDVTANADLSVFYHLSRLREHFPHDPMGYNAYVDEGELAEALGGWVTETTRTDDSPPYQTSVLINSSLALVLSDLPERIIEICLGLGEASGSVDDFNDLNGQLTSMGFGSSSATYTRTRLLNSTILKTTSRELLFKVLAGACVVVIAAFSARRKGELMSLRPGCITLDDYGERWLETWISKRQRYTTRVPANTSTARAVAILELLGAKTAKYGQSEWLLEYTDSHGAVKFDLNSVLRYLSEWFNVPPTADGTYWTFAAHQMRKFFAVAHQWRYFYPDLLVLNHQLRQLDRGTTIGYCKMEAGKALALHEDRETKRNVKHAYIWSAEDRIAALREEELSFVRKICESALAGEIKLGGVGGRTLYNDLKSLVGQHLAITSASTQSTTFNQSLDDFLQAMSMQVHPEGHSICSCGAGEQDKQVAGCLQLKQKLTGALPSKEQGADYTYADDDICASCPKNIRVKALLPYWEGQVDQADAALSSSSPEVREFALSRKAFLLDVLSEFDDGD